MDRQAPLDTGAATTNRTSTITMTHLRQGIINTDLDHYQPQEENGDLTSARGPHTRAITMDVKTPAVRFRGTAPWVHPPPLSGASPSQQDHGPEECPPHMSRDKRLPVGASQSLPVSRPHSVMANLTAYTPTLAPPTRPDRTTLPTRRDNLSRCGPASYLPSITRLWLRGRMKQCLSNRLTRSVT